MNEQIKRGHLAALERFTNNSNRAFYHAMLDAGWTPVFGLWAVTGWTYEPGIHETNAAAQAHYLETGNTPPPFGGETEPEGDYQL